VSEAFSLINCPSHRPTASRYHITYNILIRETCLAARNASTDIGSGGSSPFDLIKVADLVLKLREKCPPTQKGVRLADGVRRNSFHFQFLKFHKEVWTTLPSYIDRENFKKSKSHVGVPVWMDSYCQFLRSFMFAGQQALILAPEDPDKAPASISLPTAFGKILVQPATTTAIQSYPPLLLFLLFYLSELGAIFFKSHSHQQSYKKNHQRNKKNYPHAGEGDGEDNDTDENADPNLQRR
jgi:hypothetical protein